MNGDLGIYQAGDKFIVSKPDGSTIICQTLAEAHAAVLQFLTEYAQENGWGQDMLGKPCRHEATEAREVQGINGLYDVVACLRCHQILSRKPVNKPEHLRKLAEADGKAAGEPKECPHGREFCFGEPGEPFNFCGECYAQSVLGLLAQVPMPDDWEAP